MRQLVVDTETTGLSPKEHRLVSVAALEMLDGELTGSFCHFHVNPQRPCDPRAAQIHGLDDGYLATQPTFPNIIARFNTFIGASPLIFHNAPFDISFLEAEYARCPGFETMSNPTRCTLAQSRQTRGWKGQNKLDHLVEEFNIPNLRAQSGKHGALVDTLLLYSVYRMLSGMGMDYPQPWQLDHYFSKGFGIHGSFARQGPGGAGIPPQSQVGAPAVAADVRAVG